MAKKAGLIWIDSQGERTLHVVSTLLGVGDIETALGVHSNAGVVECWEGFDEHLSVTPVTATYPTVRETALLIYAAPTGSVGKLYLPAPKSSIFLPDGVTVDPTQITDITTAALANLLAGDGLLVTSFVGGELIATRFSGITTVA